MVTIKEIRNLTNSKRDEIRDELRHRIYDYVESIGWTNNAHKNFACPICGKGTRTPNTSIDSESYRIKSWSCGCLNDYDLFAVIEMNEPTVSNTFEALVFACNLYGYSLSADSADVNAPSVTVKQRSIPSEAESPIPPSETWQTKGKQIVEQSCRNLYQPIGERALKYLTDKRKFTIGTLKKFHIGYNPKAIYDDGKFFAPAGITIPTFIGDDLFRVKVRKGSGTPKYMNFTGSVNCCPFNEYDLLHEVDVMMVEGELDAMTIYQANECGAVSFGAMTAIPSAVTWREWLKAPERICICFDADKPGRDGETNLLNEIMRLEKIRPVDSNSVYIRHLPYELKESHGEDWNDYYTSGGDIVSLIDSFFPLQAGCYGNTSPV